jgi:hypothetical protein
MICKQGGRETEVGKDSEKGLVMQTECSGFEKAMLTKGKKASAI